MVEKRSVQLDFNLHETKILETNDEICFGHLRAVSPRVMMMMMMMMRHALMHACMHVSMDNIFACMYVCMHVCIYVCKHVCIYACMYVYAYVNLCVFCMHMHVYMDENISNSAY